MNNGGRRLAMWGAAAYGIIEGVLIIAGGGAWWDIPFYTLLNELPAGHVSWAVWSIAAGIALALGMLLDMWQLRAVGLIGMSVWAGSFAAVGLYTVWKLGTVGTTAAPTYFVLAYLFGLLVAFDDHPPHRQGGPP